MKKKASYCFSDRRVVETDVKAILCARNLRICKRMHRFGKVSTLC